MLRTGQAFVAKAQPFSAAAPTNDRGTKIPSSLKFTMSPGIAKLPNNGLC